MARTRKWVSPSFCIVGVALACTFWIPGLPIPAQGQDEGADDYYPSFYDVVMSGSAADLKQALLRGEDPNQTDQGGGTALHYVLTFSNAPLSPLVYGIVKVLLKHGALPNFPDDMGYTALHWAASFNTNEAVMESLIKAGGNPLIETSAPQTPYEIALQQGNAGAIAAIEKVVDYRPPDYEKKKMEGRLHNKWKKAFKKATTNEQRKQALRTLYDDFVKAGILTKADAEAEFQESIKQELHKRPADRRKGARQ